MNEFSNTDEAIGPPLGAGGRDSGYIYNITTQVTWAVHEGWLAWMLDDYIPAILGTGCFTRHQVVRLLETDETDGPVYAVQYYLQSRTQYDEYIALYLAGFKQLEHERWGHNVFSFSSLMQVVH